jgi:hypothetical protein
VNYNGIRFYNNASFIGGTQSSFTTMFPKAGMYMENMTFEFGKSQPVQTVSSTLSTESIVQRYLIYPFYINWDIMSLFISSIVSFRKTVSGKDILIYFTQLLSQNNFLKNALGDDANMIRLIQNYSSYNFRISGQNPATYGGNFSVMLQPILDGNYKINVRYYRNFCEDTGEIDRMLIEQQILANEKYYAKTVLLSLKENKLILTLPSHYETEGAKSEGVRKVFSKSTINPMLLRKTQDTYGQYGMIPTLINPNPVYSIYYNGNEGILSGIDVNELLCITNRYSSGIGSYLFEYEKILATTSYLFWTRETVQEHVMKIVNYFQSYCPQKNLSGITQLEQQELTTTQYVDAQEDFDAAPQADDWDARYKSGGYVASVDYLHKYLKYKKKYVDYLNKHPQKF